MYQGWIKKLVNIFNINVWKFINPIISIYYFLHVLLGLKKWTIELNNLMAKTMAHLKFNAFLPSECLSTKETWEIFVCTVVEITAP